jgi:hypothetical protein
MLSNHYVGFAADDFIIWTRDRNFIGTVASCIIDAMPEKLSETV